MVAHQAVRLGSPFPTSTARFTIRHDFWGEQHVRMTTHTTQERLGRLIECRDYRDALHRNGERIEVAPWTRVVTARTRKATS